MVSALLNRVFVEADVQRERLASCRACDRYNAERDRCQECQCVISFKTRLRVASCPAGKWGTGSTTCLTR